MVGSQSSPVCHVPEGFSEAGWFIVVMVASALLRMTLWGINTKQGGQPEEKQTATAHLKAYNVTKQFSCCRR